MGGGLPPITIGGGSGGPPGVISGAAGRAGASGSASTGSTGLLGISWPTIPWGRIAAFLLGLILIAAGLYMIKQIQQTVKTTVKTAGKAAATAAAAGDE